MKGKIISVPLFPKDIKAGMQIVLFHKDGSRAILKVDSFDQNSGFLQYTHIQSNLDSSMFLKFDIDAQYEVMSLIVEYHDKINHWMGSQPFVRRELPLKHTQWKMAITKNEVNSGKEINFEEVETKGIRYAKVIVSKKKISYPVIDYVSPMRGQQWANGMYAIVAEDVEELHICKLTADWKLTKYDDGRLMSAIIGKTNKGVTKTNLIYVEEK